MSSSLARHLAGSTCLALLGLALFNPASDVRADGIPGEIVTRQARPQRAIVRQPRIVRQAPRIRAPRAAISGQFTDQAHPWTPRRTQATHIATPFSNYPGIDGAEIPEILSLGARYGAPVQYLMLPTYGGIHGAAR